MNFSTSFIVRPIATTPFMAGILLVGCVAYLLLPVSPLPQIDFPTILVTAQLPGTSPGTMASSVATPLERQFAQMSGVSQMTSVSGIGTTAVTIQFDLSRNVDAAAQDVHAATHRQGAHESDARHRIKPLIARSLDPDPLVSNDHSPVNRAE